MKIYREICGLAVIVESPSSYEIVAPSTVHVKSWIQFVNPAEGWTMAWKPHNQDLIVSPVRWPSKEAVVMYLRNLGRRAG